MGSKVPPIIPVFMDTKIPSPVKTALPTRGPGGRSLLHDPVGLKVELGVSDQNPVEKAFSAVEKIHFDGAQYRKDIGE